MVLLDGWFCIDGVLNVGINSEPSILAIKSRVHLNGWLLLTTINKTTYLAYI
jgi:hypothetical protein